MRETLDYIRVEFRKTVDLQGAISADVRLAHLPLRGVLKLVADLEEGPASVEFAIERIGGQIQLVLSDSSEMPEGLLRRIPRLADGLNLPEAANIIPSWIMLSGNCEWVKRNDRSRWIYQYYTPQGLQAIRRELRRRYEVEQPNYIIIETPDAKSPRPGIRCVIRPPGSDSQPLVGNAVIFPDDELFPSFAGVQIDYISSCQLSLDPPPLEETVDPAMLRALAVWLHGYPARFALAKEALAGSVLPGREVELRRVLERLSHCEEQLMMRTVAGIERTLASAREAINGFLKDLRGQQEALTSSLSMEAFKITSAVAVTLAGLHFSQLATDVQSFWLALGIGSIFLAGAILRSFSIRSEWESVMRLYASTQTPDVSKILGQDSPIVGEIQTAQRRFYWTFSLMLALLCLPMLALSSFGLTWSMRNPSLRVLTSSALIVGLLMLYLGYCRCFSPWRDSLKITLRR